MNDKDIAYWEKRQEQKFLAGEKKVKYYKELEESFEKTRLEIKKLLTNSMENMRMKIKFLFQ